MTKRGSTSQRCLTTLLGLQTNLGGGVRDVGYEEPLDSELQGAAARVMPSRQRWVRFPENPLTKATSTLQHTMPETAPNAARDSSDAVNDVRIASTFQRLRALLDREAEIYVLAASALQSRKRLTACHDVTKLATIVIDPASASCALFTPRIRIFVDFPPRIRVPCKNGHEATLSCSQIRALSSVVEQQL